MRSYPDSIICCPLEILRKRFAENQDQALSAYMQETAAATLDCESFSPLVSEIRSAFVDLVRLASRADVLVAYLPDHDASMGTAMEMWGAYSCDKVIITISSMTRNLAIVATSTLVLPSIEQFDGFLTSACLEALIKKRRGPK